MANNTRASQTPAPNYSFTGRTGGPGGLVRRDKVYLKDVKGTILRILKYLAEKKGRLAVVFSCALVTTLISIVGARLNGYTVDNFIKTGDARGLAFICLIMLGIYFVNVFSTYGQNVLMVGVAQRVSARIRSDLVKNLQKLPLRFFDTHSSGDLMSRLTNDVDNINTTLSQGVVQLFSGVVNIVGMLISMLLLSPLLTLIAMVMLPLMFVTAKIIAKKSQPYYVEQQLQLGILNGFIEEMVSAQKVVRIFSREAHVKTEFSEINRKLVRSAVISQAATSIMGPVNNIINNTSYLIVTVVGALFIIRGMGGITVGAVFSFLLYMRNFTRPINDIFNLFNTIQSALAGAERVFEIIDEEKERDLPGTEDVADITGDVEMENVDFSYVPGKPVLKRAGLSAKHGQTVAIVGPTGAGKTTIINLLTKFYDIDGGRIAIDGRDIRDITSKSLRRRISVVLQDPYLFSETVRENIRYGRLNASDEDVVHAARMAHAHEFIMQLPGGYDTVLADNGSNLSQGQRQLLSIARAIIADSSVLILDEATSSVDTRTELLIQNALLTLMRGKTCFVIAHRLSTIRHADKIVVISDGRVMETGTHEELMERGGLYAELYNSQFKSGMAL